MPWKHIVAPTKGLVTNFIPEGIDNQASPFMSGVILVDGEVKSDFGMTDYPVPGVLKTNALNGTVLKIEQFYLLDGTSYLIALTTTHVYTYNTATDTWDVLTRGNVLDDCEDAWVAGTGIVSTANGDVKLRGTYSAKHIILEGVPAIHLPMNDDAADTDVEDTGGDFTATASQNTEDLTAGGTVGDALNFESTVDEDYIDNDNAGLQAGILDDTVGSIAFWVRPESLAADMIICSWADTDSTGRLDARLEATTGILRVKCHNGTAIQWDVSATGSPITAGVWAHVVITQNGTTPVITINAVTIALTYNTSTDLTVWIAGITGIDNSRIACESFGSTGNANFFDGLLDDWRYYSTVIPTSDIVALTNAGNGTAEVGGFTTGIISSEAATTADISAATNTHLSFWIYSDIAIAAEVLSMRISEQAAGATGATYADYYIPAIVAATWQHVTVAIAAPDADNGGTYPADLNAVSSIALVANSDPGTCIIYVDDVRTTQCFTGDEDNRWSVATMNDSMVITNGVDAPTKIHVPSVLTHAAHTLTLPTGAITTCEVVLAFKDHMLYFNNTENGGDAPQRCSWTNIGSIVDHVAGTAGFQDLLDDDSWIIGSEILSENEIAVYKERSIIQCVWIGGHTPFRFVTMVSGKGAMTKDTIMNTDKGHIVADSDTIYRYKGSADIDVIDDKVKNDVYSSIDGAYASRAFMLYVKADDEVQLWIPTASTTPDAGYTIDIAEGTWHLKDRNISGYGDWKAQSSLTIGDLIGTIGEQDWTFGSQLTKQYFPITLVGNSSGKVFYLDRLSLNNDASAITNEFQTPDFVLPDQPQYMNHYMRVIQLIFEAAGQSISTFYSTDGGSTWHPTQGAGTHVTALDSIYTSYQQDFETNAKRIRFKFFNDTASSGFNLRHYGFNWMPRTGRK